MKIEIRNIDDIKILDLSGQLTLGEATKALRNTVNDIMQAGGKRIIFNLANLSLIDSPGVGQLADSYKTFRDQGGEIKLLNLTKKIHSVLYVAKLLTVFEVSDSEQALVASFANPAVQGQTMDQLDLASGRAASVA